MKKVNSYKDFRKGKIYNRVYVGENQAYAKINGKETFIVLKIRPSLQVQILFDRFGSVNTDDLRSGIVTFDCPEKAFAEFEFFEPENRDEWFIKSAKLGSLAEAIKAGFIKREQIENLKMNAKELVFFHNIGVYRQFSVNGVPENPYLQNVYVLWKTFEAARKDFADYGTIVSW